MRHASLVVLVGLIVSSSALAQPETPALAACGLHEPKGPHQHGLGTVIGIQDPAVAHAGISAREAQRGGAIDPRYQNDLRAAIRQDDGLVDNFDVPPGMTVHVGDRVKLLGSYRSRTSTCSYVPHMAVPGDTPMA